MASKDGEVNGRAHGRVAAYDALVLGRFLLFPRGCLPDQLRDRAVPLYAVDLQPSETPEMYGERLAWPLAPDDLVVLRAVAKGTPTRAIATEIGVSTRTVQRHIARLRRRLRVASEADLRDYLKERGFLI
jgi:DNA-binding CsgD family transcriptional regulator